MIQIYRGESELGVALFDYDTNEFVYGELCNKQRLITFINSFPEHQVTIFIERAWQDEIQEIFFLLPHLQDLAKVKIQKQINVPYMLKRAVKVPIKRNASLMYLLVGIILGSLMLLPLSTEYKDSVLVQATAKEGFANDFIQKQPNEQSLQQLYTSIDTLYTKVRVEAVTYSLGTFKVIFSSASEDWTVDQLEGFEMATLEKVSSLENGEGTLVHIYELEGNL